jgi:hypothetical protein
MLLHGRPPSFGIAPLSALIYASLTLALIGVDLLIPSNDNRPHGSNVAVIISKVNKHWHEANTYRELVS